MDKEAQTYIASIEHAMALVGGVDALANRLDVAAEKVLGWARGAHTPDTVSLLRVLDVVIVETRKLSSEAMAFGLAELALAKAAASAKDATGQR